MAGTDGSFVSTGAFNLEVLGSNAGRIFVIVVVHNYTVLQTVQKHGVYMQAWSQLRAPPVAILP